MRNEEEVLVASAREKIVQLVREHLSVLADKRMKGITVDEYGVVNAKRWNRDAQYFYDHVVCPRLTDMERQAIVNSGIGPFLTELIEWPARKECKRIESGGNVVANPRL